MRFAVVTFPGSNCDRDCIHAIEDTIKQSVTSVWHKETDLSIFDAIILPGGFSYGDYLRPGALSRFSPIIQAVEKEAKKGKLVIGICNGFQILLEMGLLPGVLMKNNHLKFRCDMQSLVVKNNITPFTLYYNRLEKIHLPIAHGEGNYFCDEMTLRQLQENEQIVLVYSENNPNGSIDNIAGICNESKNVFGLMPHPERAITKWMGSDDGLRLFTSMMQYWGENHRAFTRSS